MRIRLTYSETDTLRFTGHLDMQRVWERMFRRSRLPIAYSQGFHPQARIQIASALPLGFTSRCELLDFWLDGSFTAEEIEKALEATVHPGIRISHVAEVDLTSPALQTRVAACEYQVTFLDPNSTADLEARVQNILSKLNLPRVRREKNYDLRPLIESIDLIRTEDQPQLLMRLTARENATGRPDEVLLAMGLDPFTAKIERTQLFLMV